MKLSEPNQALRRIVGVSTALLFANPGYRLGVSVIGLIIIGVGVTGPA